MFAQSELYTNHIDAYFAKHPQPSISWIHNLGKGRWTTTSQTLLSQANGTSDLATRHVSIQGLSMRFS